MLLSYKGYYASLVKRSCGFNSYKKLKKLLREGKRESQRKLVVEGRTKRTNLTIETVRNIKTDLATMSRKDICNKYGITKSTLANIARGETFQYID